MIYHTSHWCVRTSDPIGAKWPSSKTPLRQVILVSTKLNASQLPFWFAQTFFATLFLLNFFCSRGPAIVYALAKLATFSSTLEGPSAKSENVADLHVLLHTMLERNQCAVLTFYRERKNKWKINMEMKCIWSFLHYFLGWRSPPWTFWTMSQWCYLANWNESY